MRNGSRLTAHGSRLLFYLMATGIPRAHAYDDWDDERLVVDEAGGDFPVGGAIRNWGPSRDVFVVHEERDGTSNENSTTLMWYTCDNSSCSTDTFEGSYPFGDAIFGQSTTTVSMGIYREGAGYPIEIGITRREKQDTDCDNDSSEWPTDGDEAAMDLVFYRWDTSEDFDSVEVVDINGSSCADRGLSRTRRFGGQWHSCFTWQPDPNDNSDDRVRCNNSANATWNWPNNITMKDPTSNGEDHPGFDFKGNDLVVVGNNNPVNPNNAQVIVHFPDDTAPPNEPTFPFLLGGTDKGVCSESTDGVPERLIAYD